MNDTLLLWPLIFILDDGFRPESAQLVMEVALEYDLEVRWLVWKFAAEAAREQINVN